MRVSYLFKVFFIVMPYIRGLVSAMHSMFLVGTRVFEKFIGIQKHLECCAEDKTDEQPLFAPSKYH